VFNLTVCRVNPILVQIGQKTTGTLHEDLRTFTTALVTSVTEVPSTIIRKNI
jgi:hypothetical protein